MARRALGPPADWAQFAAWDQAADPLTQPQEHPAGGGAGRSVLDDTPTPPGFLPRAQQRAWGELLQHVVFKAILDADMAKPDSADEHEALEYLRDEENGRLFEFAGLPAAGVRWSVREREPLAKTAGLVRQLLVLKGLTTTTYWDAVQDGRSGGRRAGTRPPRIETDRERTAA